MNKPTLSQALEACGFTSIELITPANIGEPTLVLMCKDKAGSLLLMDTLPDPVVITWTEKAKTKQVHIRLTLHNSTATLLHMDLLPASMMFSVLKEGRVATITTGYNTTHNDYVEVHMHPFHLDLWVEVKE